MKFANYTNRGGAGINPIRMMDRICSERYRQVQYMGNKQKNEIHFQKKMQSSIDQGTKKRSFFFFCKGAKNSICSVLWSL